MSQSFEIKHGGEAEWARLAERYPEGVAVGRWSGDWGLGSGTFHFRAFVTARDSDGRPIHADLLIAHTHTRNNPIGWNPMSVEGLLIEGLEVNDLRALRDWLDEMIEQGAS